MKLTKGMAQDLFTKLDGVMAQFVKDNNLEGHTLSARKYSSEAGDISGRFEIVVARDEDFDTELFDNCAYQLGLPSGLRHKTFQQGNMTYLIVDLKPRSPKYPVIAQNIATGEQYKFPITVAQTINN